MAMNKKLPEQSNSGIRVTYGIKKWLFIIFLPCMLLIFISNAVKAGPPSICSKLSAYRDKDLSAEFTSNIQKHAVSPTNLELYNEFKSEMLYENYLTGVEWEYALDITVSTLQTVANIVGGIIPQAIIDTEAPGTTGGLVTRFHFLDRAERDISDYLDAVKSEARAASYTVLHDVVNKSDAARELIAAGNGEWRSIKKLKDMNSGSEKREKLQSIIMKQFKETDRIIADYQDEVNRAFGDMDTLNQIRDAIDKHCFQASVSSDESLTDFTLSPSGGKAPLSILMEVQTSSQNTKSGIDYRWELTGGPDKIPSSKPLILGTGSFTDKVLYRPGKYKVTLVVTRDGEMLEKKSRTIDVLENPDHPAYKQVADFTLSPPGGEAPLSVSMEAKTLSHNISGLDYRWELTGGPDRYSGNSVAIGTGLYADKVLNKPGVYTVALSVAKDGRELERKSKTVRVLNSSHKVSTDIVHILIVNHKKSENSEISHILTTGRGGLVLFSSTRKGVERFDKAILITEDDEHVVFTFDRTGEIVDVEFSEGLSGPGMASTDANQETTFLDKRIKTVIFDHNIFCINFMGKFINRTKDCFQIVQDFLIPTLYAQDYNDEIREYNDDIDSLLRKIRKEDIGGEPGKLIPWPEREKWKNEYYKSEENPKDQPLSSYTWKNVKDDIEKAKKALHEFKEIVNENISKVTDSVGNAVNDFKEIFKRKESTTVVGKEGVTVPNDVYNKRSIIDRSRISYVKKEDNSNSEKMPPNAGFTLSPPNGSAPLLVALDRASDRMSGEEIRWTKKNDQEIGIYSQMSPMSFSSDNDPSVLLETPGKYTITLTVTKGWGSKKSSNSWSQTVTVEEKLQAPENFTVSKSGKCDVQLSWSTVKGARGYKIYQSGYFLKQTTAGSSYIPKPGSGTHYFTVSAWKITRTDRPRSVESEKSSGSSITITDEECKDDDDSEDLEEEETLVKDDRSDKRMRLGLMLGANVGKDFLAKKIADAQRERREEEMRRLQREQEARYRTAVNSGSTSNSVSSAGTQIASPQTKKPYKPIPLSKGTTQIIPRRRSGRELGLSKSGNTNYGLYWFMSQDKEFIRDVLDSNK